MFPTIHTNEELLAAREELYRLGGTDPDEALQRVKGLTGTAEYRAAVENLQAGVLIDVGAVKWTPISGPGA